jgi:hypothetical protein
MRSLAIMPGDYAAVENFRKEFSRAIDQTDQQDIVGTKASASRISKSVTYGKLHVHSKRAYALSK